MRQPFCFVVDVIREDGTAGLRAWFHDHAAALAFSARQLRRGLSPDLVQLA